jgi:hypothetical protein
LANHNLVTLKTKTKMKKVIVILSVFLLSATLTFGQFLTPFRVASTSVAFGKTVPSGATIDYGSASYYTTALAGASQTLQGMITAGTAKLKSSSVTDSLYLHSTGIEKAYANYTFSGTNVFTGTTTATITGHSTLDELAAHKQVATSTSAILFPTWSGAKAYTDSVGALLARIASPTFTGTITGGSMIRGSGAFSAALTRVAVYLAGATSSDYYIVRGIAADQYTRPVAADFMNCFAKTDSLIVMRAAGTTANLGFTYFRIK